jgi:hypothetical protein
MKKFADEVLQCLLLVSTELTVRVCFVTRGLICYIISYLNQSINKLINRSIEKQFVCARMTQWRLHTCISYNHTYINTTCATWAPARATTLYCTDILRNIFSPHLFALHLPHLTSRIGFLSPHLPSCRFPQIVIYILFN